MESLLRLVQKLQLELQPPATDADIAELETTLGHELPSNLRAFYKTTNGLVLKQDFLHIMSVQEVNKFVTIQEVNGQLQHFYYRGEFRYLPFTDSFDSDRFCLCCDEIMTGYIVYDRHDAAPQLQARSFEDFLDSLSDYYADGFYEPLSPEELAELEADLLEGDDPFDYRELRFVEDLPTQFAQSLERTPHDVETGRKLIESIPEGLYVLDDMGYEHYDRTTILLFGMELITAPTEIAALANRLNLDKVLERLENLNTPEALEQQAILEREFEKFVDHCIKQLNSVGLVPIKTTPSKYEVVLRLEKPSVVHLNMVDFYNQLKQDHESQADFDAFFIKHVQDWLEEKRKK